MLIKLRKGTEQLARSGFCQLNGGLSHLSLLGCYRHFHVQNDQV